MNNRFKRIFWILSLIPLFFLFQNFTTQNNLQLRKYNLNLDGGQTIQVWSKSIYNVNELQTFVLAADRSTVNGCPYNSTNKGLFSSTDAIYITDNYVAWFDYSVGYDGLVTTGFARSGALAGYWSLNPSQRNFKYFFGKNDSRNGICWNWARNELIPGSNSPQGFQYWWDKYAPALEHSLVIKNPKPIIKPTDYLLYGTIYSQHTQNITLTNQPPTNDARGLRFKSTSKLTSWGGASAEYTTSALAADGTTTTIDSELDYLCTNDKIEVNWKFKPNKNLNIENIYVNLWMAYSGLDNQNFTCAGENQDYPVPGKLFQNGAFAQSYNFTSSNIKSYAIQNTGALKLINPLKEAQFPWSQYTPCSGMNGGIKTDYLAKSLNAGTYLKTSYAPKSTGPQLQFTYLSSPCTSSTCGSSTQPIDFKFNRMILNYESSDQQQGLILTRENDTQMKLNGGKYYFVKYSISAFSSSTMPPPPPPPPPTQICIPSTQKSCSIANGIGVQTCNSTGTGYSTCNVVSCNRPFLKSGNTCIENNSPRDKIYSRGSIVLHNDGLNNGDRTLTLRDVQFDFTKTGNIIATDRYTGDVKYQTFLPDQNCLPSSLCQLYFNELGNGVFYNGFNVYNQTFTNSNKLRLMDTPPYFQFEN